MIRDGFITDYDGTHADKISFAMVATANAALALMVGTKRYGKFAADIPHCSTDTAVSVLQGFKEAARRLDCENRTTRSARCTRLIGIVTGRNLGARVANGFSHLTTMPTFRILGVDGRHMRIHGQMRGPRRSDGELARFDPGGKLNVRHIVRG